VSRGLRLDLESFIFKLKLALKISLARLMFEKLLKF
jgi:hypothetical protein